jgi:hypothetical protein
MKKILLALLCVGFFGEVGWSSDIVRCLGDGMTGPTDGSRYGVEVYYATGASGPKRHYVLYNSTNQNLSVTCAWGEDQRSVDISSNDCYDLFLEGDLRIIKTRPHY